MLKSIYVMSLLLCGFVTTDAQAKDLNYISGEFLIEIDEAKFNPKNVVLSRVSSVEYVAQSTFLLRYPVSARSKSFIRKFTQGKIKELLQQPGVTLAEPNYIWRISKRPNDSSYASLWGLRNRRKPGIDIQAERAWNITTGSSRVVVAVIDTGVDYRHRDLRDNMWVNSAERDGRPNYDDDSNGVKDDIYGYNFVRSSRSYDPRDDQGHGTHCAGTIGATGNNRTGITGVNWNVSIMALKFLDKDGAGANSDAVRAIDYAGKMGAHVINASWGGPENSKILKRAIERVRKKDVLFVTAAGNDGVNNDYTPSYPANYGNSNIVSVAAINKSGSLAGFSSYGKKKVHIAAPGVSILSTIPGNRYDRYDGTSMASPHVAGVAALIKSKYPRYSYRKIKNKLLSTVTKRRRLKNKVSSGGIVNAYKALK